MNVHLLWQLHTAGVLELSAFILNNINNSSAISCYSDNLANACVVSKQQYAQVLSGTLQHLVGTAFGVVGEQGDQERCARRVCDTVLDRVLDHLLDFMSTDTLEEDWRNPFSDVCDESNEEATKAFHSHVITFTLTHKCPYKMSKAITSQEKWTFAKSPPRLTAFYKHIMRTFEAREISTFLQGVLEKKKVHWRHFLSFTATFLLQFSEAPDLLRNTAEDLLQTGFKNFDEDSMLTAFLLVRQASLEGTHILSYCNWFTSTFVKADSLANTKKSFSFFMTFLSRLVQHERNSYFLTVHVTRLPYFPPKCRPLLSDYVALAKTRLADLKVPDDELQILNPSPSKNVAQSTCRKLVDKAKADVTSAISVFQKTGKVPSTVMEQSIFNKPYYIGKYFFKI